MKEKKRFTLSLKEKELLFHEKKEGFLFTFQGALTSGGLP
jgi:hypothetical protein